MFDSISSGKYWDEGISLVEGCSPFRCNGCWAASASHMRKSNPFVAHRHKDLTVVIDGVATFNGNTRIFVKELERPKRKKKPTAYHVWTDLFHRSVSDDTLHLAFSTFASCPHHIFFVLTQRIARAKSFLDHFYSIEDIPVLKNVIVGTTVRDIGDEFRAHTLIQTPAYARFISAEPLRSYIGIEEILSSGGIDLVVIGGSTGQCRDIIKTEYVKSLIEQSTFNGVNVFFKSWGSNCPGQIKNTRTAFGKLWNRLPIVEKNGIFNVQPIRENTF